MRLTFYACFLFNILLAPHVHARQATAKDLSSIVESEAVQITVAANGTSRLIREVSILVQNDDGRERAGLQTVTFNARSERVRILEARTETAGVKYPVNLKKNVEFKEVGDFGRSFDRLKQAAITYPNVQIGSRIYLKYEFERNEIPFQNFFSMGLILEGSWYEKLRLVIRSKLPLHHWLNDPRGRLVSKAGKEKTKTGEWHTLEIQSTGPLDIVAAQEEFAYFRPERSPYITVSSLPNWQRFARETLPLHEKLISEPLPPTLEKIRKAAAEESSVPAKLSKLSAMLNEEFRYFGDWRRRHGGHVPRTLKEIAETRYGDCKDLSLAVAAIARRLGMKANLSWIWRSVNPVHPQAYSIPIEGFFNHAIARVEADGKVYWLDATNPVSFVEGTFADIAGRPTFVVDSENPRLETTPPVEPTSGRFTKDFSFEYQADQTLKATGVFSATGRSAIGFTIESFYNPPAAMDWTLVRTLAFDSKIISYKVGDFERRSRVVRDLKIPVEYVLPDVGLRTSAGPGFPLVSEDSLRPLLLNMTDRTSDLLLDVLVERWANTEIRGVKKVGSESLDCDLKSEWLNISRRVLNTSGGVRIEDRMAPLKMVVPNEALSTPEFRKFQGELRDCFYRSAVILERE